ncbi:MAG TPA: hypothetical protein VF960_03740 [Chloroflexota bacterium]
MAQYQTIIPHDESQCVEALDDMLASDPELQSHVVYGCHFGDHTGYAVLEAADEAAVRKRLPQSLNRRARVVEVEHFTPEQIKANHDKQV